MSDIEDDSFFTDEFQECPMCDGDGYVLVSDITDPMLRAAMGGIEEEGGRAMCPNCGGEGEL